MTVPKGKGYRQIIVAGRAFKWRFAKRIVIVPEGAGRQVLEVDLGWFDKWLHANDQVDQPPAFAPLAITPAFVAEAIAFAVKGGWDENARGGRLLLKYTAEQGFSFSPRGCS